jgi:hypothetical protein
MNKYLLDKKCISLRRKESGTYYNLLDKILIFDTFFGLCNQIFDIHYGINYCLKNNIKFTFRYANFRKDDLITFYNVNFDELFDTSFLKDIDLYVDINTLELNDNNTCNFNDNIRAQTLLKNNIKYLKYIKQPYIVLKGIFPLIENVEICKDILSIIRPSPKIIKIYNNIYNKLGLNENPYNFFHYRYEKDFTLLHQLSATTSLELLLNKIQFKNNTYKIYLASSNIKNILKNIKFDHLIYKNEDELSELNFEERAFIDFMIGKYSVEVYGHPMSSFSHTLNRLKNTQNFY